MKTHIITANVVDVILVSMFLVLMKGKEIKTLTQTKKKGHFATQFGPFPCDFMLSSFCYESFALVKKKG